MNIISKFSFALKLLLGLGGATGTGQPRVTGIKSASWPARIRKFGALEKCQVSVRAKFCAKPISASGPYACLVSHCVSKFARVNDLSSARAACIDRLQNHSKSAQAKQRVPEQFLIPSQARASCCLHKSPGDILLLSVAVRRIGFHTGER